METNENQNNETPTNGGSKSIYVSIDAFILAINTALNNAGHPDLEPLLTKRGYPKKTLDEVKPKVANLETLNQNQKKEYSEQYEATQTYIKDWNTLKDIYSSHVELARIVFEKDIQNYVLLGLQGKRKQSFSGYTQQAKLFYTNALKSKPVIEKLELKGVTEDELTETLTLISKVEVEKYNQNKEAGEAQQATKERDAACDLLDEWFSEFKRTVMVDLSNKPELARILGF